MKVLERSWTESMMGKRTSPILVGTVLESGIKRDTRSGELKYFYISFHVVDHSWGNRQFTKAQTSAHRLEVEL